MKLTATPSLGCSTPPVPSVSSPNPLLGPNGLFAANVAQYFAHLLTAVGFTAVAVAGSKRSVVFMQVFGVIYLSISKPWTNSCTWVLVA
jgi:hypothetical protein